MNITRLGHVELYSHDLDRAVDFYTEVIGLVETEREDGRAYLRCVEDRHHHALVLTESDHNGCGHIAFRVASEDDVDELKRIFEADGLNAVEVEAEHERGQGRAVRVADPAGFPMEFFHAMEPAERRTRTHGNFGPTRIDHVNLRIPTPVDDAVAYYRDRLGFMISEFATHPDGTKFAAWMHRKQTTHDLAWVHGEEKFIHHAGFYVPESHDVLAIADRMAARGMQGQIEFGPGRHGITNAFFSYLRDPDGNRIEIYSGDYLIADPDWEPIEWTHEEFEATGRLAWGSRPPESMYEGQAVDDWSQVTA
ncbi:MAG: 3,4-dihydroxyphenylacetate 2,3-dioxygenase [Solirubrobacterales bacterium]